MNVLIFLLKKKRAYFRKMPSVFIFFCYLGKLSDTYEIYNTYFALHTFANVIHRKLIIFLESILLNHYRAARFPLQSIFQYINISRWDTYIHKRIMGVFQQATQRAQCNTVNNFILVYIRQTIRMK